MVINFFAIKCIVINVITKYMGIGVGLPLNLSTKKLREESRQEHTPGRDEPCMYIAGSWAPLPPTKTR